MLAAIRLIVDLLVLPFYPLWFILIGRFIVYTPYVDDEQLKVESILYNLWIVITIALIGHIIISLKDDRYPVFLQLFRRLQRCLRNCALKWLEHSILRDFLKFIHLPTVCISANAFFEVSFVVCTILTALIVLQRSICDEIEAFYFQNMFFLILYSALRVRCRDLYDVEKLVVHFAYACLHLGCLGEHLGYSGSYYVINVGMEIFTLRVLWYLLNVGSSRQVAGGEVGPSGGAPPPNPQAENPPVDNPPGDTGLSPRGPQWKLKGQKRKKK